MSLVKRSERVTSSWKGAIADIAIRSMPNAVERLLVTERPIILTAIKTMKPTISTIFLENIELDRCFYISIRLKVFENFATGRNISVLNPNVATSGLSSGDDDFP